MLKELRDDVRLAQLVQRVALLSRGACQTAGPLGVNVQRQARRGQVERCGLELAGGRRIDT